MGPKVKVWWLGSVSLVGGVWVRVKAGKADWWMDHCWALVVNSRRCFRMRRLARIRRARIRDGIRRVCGSAGEEAGGFGVGSGGSSVSDGSSGLASESSKWLRWGRWPIWSVVVVGVVVVRETGLVVVVWLGCGRRPVVAGG